jgi:hypothetical protein
VGHTQDDTQNSIASAMKNMNHAVPFPPFPVYFFEEGSNASPTVPSDNPSIAGIVFSGGL